MSEQRSPNGITPSSLNTLAAGLTRYFTDGQLTRLGTARIGIAGAGGLGSNVAMLLARSGVRHLTLVDHDVVDASNLNRQWYFPEDIGHPKVEALAAHLYRLEPGMRLSLHRETLSPGTAAACFSGCEVLVEALDTPEAKAMLYGTMRDRVTFTVCASGLGGWGKGPMSFRRIHERAVLVGDGVTEAGGVAPPIAPRTVQAAAMQADAVISFLLGGVSEKSQPSPGSNPEPRKR